MTEQAPGDGVAPKGLAPTISASAVAIPHGVSWVEKAQSKIDTDPELIRGMHVQDLMRGFASILGSSLGTADQYNLSKQLPLIQTFLSHNWSTPRLHKILVLVYHYNLLPALMVMLVVCAALLALMMLEVLPNVTVVGVVSDPDNSFTRGVFCLPLGTLVFFATLFGFHEATRRCCTRSHHTMFLDKTCINQIDPDLKMKGIQSLAAFLNHSGEMLLVFTDTYMQKLWTVYEVATWLMLHKGANMVVRPTFVPMMLLASSVVLFLWELLWLLQAIVGYTSPETMTTSVRLISSTLFAFPAFTAIARITALWASERESISEHLANFRFSNAKCFCEDDRRVVQDNIVAFMKFSHTCAADATAEEAVEAFEDLARRVVPKAMDVGFGWVGIPYPQLLTANVPRLLMHFDRAVGYYVDAVPGYEVFWHVSDNIFEFFVLLPILDAYLLGCMRCKVLRSWCGCVFVGVSGYLGVIASIVVFDSLTSMGVDSPVWLAVHLPLRALLCVFVFLLYRPTRVVRSQQTR